MSDKPSLTLGGFGGLTLDEGKVHAKFLWPDGRPAVFDVFDDFSMNATVVLVSKKPVKPVIKADPMPPYRWPLDMRLTIPVYSVNGVAKIRLAQVEHSVVPFVNLPWLRKKILLDRPDLVR